MKAVLTAILLLTSLQIIAAEMSEEEAIQLIERSCVGCVGSKANLQRAVESLEAEIASKDSIAFSSRKYLSEAYNTLAIVYYKDGSQEREASLDKAAYHYALLAKEAQEHIFSGDVLPHDLATQYAEVLLAHARNVDVNERIEFLEAAIKASPENPQVLHSYGYALLDVGREDAAFAVLEKSLYLSGEKHALSAGIKLFNKYLERGYVEEYEKSLARLERKLSRDLSFVRERFAPAVQSIIDSRKPINEAEVAKKDGEPLTKSGSPAHEPEMRSPSDKEAGRNQGNDEAEYSWVFIVGASLLFCLLVMMTFPPNLAP